MTMETLLTDHLDIWTSALQARPASGRGGQGKTECYGIRKLRELILELAVRGKLVPQQPDDEPASVLLERIAAEKAALVKLGKIKKPKPLPAITDDEKPFDLPDGWQYVQLGQVVSVVRGITFPASEKYTAPAEGKIACLRTANVQDEIEWDDLLYVSQSYVKRAEQYAEKGDIVISMANSRELVGKVAYLADIPTGEATFGGFLSVIRPFIIDAGFLMSVLRAPETRSRLIDSASQTTNIANISLEKLNPLVIALPPLAEQQRIVSQVNTLLSLCDRLEQHTAVSQTQHQQLVETLLSVLLNSRHADELADSWGSIARHIDTLFTTGHSIEALKRTVLQLAVMGKLVPQDPEDEPVAGLLKRVEQQQAQWVRDGKIKKQKPLPNGDADEKPFDLPDGWVWRRVADMAYVFSGNTFKSEDFNHEGGVKCIKITNTGVKAFIHTEDYLPESFAERYPEVQVSQGDLLLAMTRPYISSGLKISRCPADYHHALLNQRVCAIRPYHDSLFYYEYLSSERVLNFYQARFNHSGLQPNLKMSDITELWIPVPPAGEQVRILAAMQQVAALCDRLKTRMQAMQQTQAHLADALTDAALY